MTDVIVIISSFMWWWCHYIFRILIYKERILLSLSKTSLPPTSHWPYCYNVPISIVVYENASDLLFSCDEYAIILLLFVFSFVAASHLDTRKGVWRLSYLFNLAILLCLFQVRHRFALAYVTVLCVVNVFASRAVRVVPVCLHCRQNYLMSLSFLLCMA
jgi:hypothetical protein